MRTSGLSASLVQRLAGGASRLAALLLPQILPVSSVVAPGQPGAALRDLVLVQRGHTTRRRAIEQRTIALRAYEGRAVSRSRSGRRGSVPPLRHGRRSC